MKLSKVFNISCIFFCLSLLFYTGYIFLMFSFFNEYQTWVKDVRSILLIIGMTVDIVIALFVIFGIFEGFKLLLKKADKEWKESNNVKDKLKNPHE